MKLLVVGNMTWDKVQEGKRAGGSVLFCSRVYAELGHDVTVYGHMSDERAFAPNVEVLSCGDQVAGFENLYDAHGARQQRVWQVGAPLGPPAELGAYDVVHVAPVLDEIDLGVWNAPLREVPKVVAGLQGWLRRVDREGRVDVKGWAGRPAPFDLAVLSQEDIDGLDRGFIANLCERIPRVALTDGARGATLYRGARELHVPGWSVDAIDPTGAGDVFTAALTHALFERGWSDRRSAEFACGAAAHVVTDHGQRALETLTVRLSEYMHD